MNKKKLGIDIITIAFVFVLYAFGCYSQYKLESLLVFLFVAIGINVVFYRRKNLIIPKLMVLLLVFQNFFIGFFSHMSGKVENISYMTQFAFVFCVIAFGVAIWNEKKLSKLDIAFIIFAVILCALFLTTTADKMSAIIYFRNFTTFYFAYFVGKYYIDTAEKCEGYVRFLVLLSVLTVIFGLIMMYMPVSAWDSIGVHEVYIAKKNDFPQGQLPGRFYTIFLSQNEEYTIRMASLYYEPVNLSYLLSGCIALMMCLKKMEKKYITLGLLAVGALLTFGKGGLLFLGLLVGIMLVQVIFEQLTTHFPKSKVVGFSVFFIIVALVCVSALYFVFIGGTAVYHFFGIFQSIPYILKNPMGYGLGNGGNMGVLHGSNAEGVNLLQSGGESGLMSMFFQLGIFAGTYFILLWILVGSSFRAVKDSIFSKYARYYLKFIPIFLVVVSIFQENTYTPQCIIPIMLGVGGLANLCNKKRRRESYETSV